MYKYIYIYIYMVFGHNSVPRKIWGAPLGGNESYRPLGAFEHKIFEIGVWKFKMLGGHFFFSRRKKSKNMKH